MAKPELGTKRVCVACGAHFYDLTKQPAVCPKCGVEQPAEQPRLRRGAGNPLPEEKHRPKPAVADGLEDADVDVEVSDDDEAGEDVLEDTSDLEGGDDTGVGVAIEPEPGEEEH